MENFNAILEDKTFLDLNPRSCGCIQCPPNENMGVTFRDYTMIHYVVSGKGKLYINKKVYSIKEEQIFVVPQGVKNKYVADKDDPWAFIWISFDGNLSEKFASLPPVLDFKSPFFFELLNVKNMPTLKKEFLAQMLFKLYIELFQNDSRIDYVSAIKNYIDNNYMYHDISVEKIASSLNLNRSYVSRIFSKKQEITIQDYIIRVRMIKAKELLIKGNSVQTTAKTIGYLDQFQFSKAFKKFYGEAPNFFKKNILMSNTENTSAT